MSNVTFNFSGLEICREIRSPLYNYMSHSMIHDTASYYFKIKICPLVITVCPLQLVVPHSSINPAMKQRSRSRTSSTSSTRSGTPALKRNKDKKSKSAKKKKKIMVCELVCICTVF